MLVKMVKLNGPPYDDDELEEVAYDEEEFDEIDEENDDEEDDDGDYD